MLTYLTTPTPHTEARQLITSKPAVAREVFDKLAPELKSRAFTITGIEDFDVLQSVQDQIAALPAGADWGAVKKGIIAKISPWLDEAEAGRRAELLMKFHGFNAYLATSLRVSDEMRDVFPYKQWLGTLDTRERASHLALEKVILPADHPRFRKREFGCRCQWADLTQEEYDEEKGRDAQRGEESKLVMSPAQLTQLDAGMVTRGPNANFPLGTPMTDLRDTTLPYSEIKRRWTPEVATAFEDWAGKQAVGLDSLLSILQGNAVFQAAGLPESEGGKALFTALAQGAVMREEFSAGAPGLVARMAAVDAEKVTAFEARVRDQRIEHGLAFDKMGNTLWQGVGAVDQISIPKQVDLEGMGFSHNHPSGESFSVKDITQLLKRRMGEVRAVTHHGTYSVRRKPGVRAAKLESRIREILPDITASLKPLQTGSNFDPEQTNDLLWRVLAQEGMIDYEYTPMKPLLDKPLREALSARPPTAAEAEEDTLFISYPSSAYRDFLDGKAEYPGLAALSALAREEAEMAE